MLDHRVKTFLTLCKTKNYTRTAECLHITQPAVSQHIKYLESELQVKLFYYDDKKHLHLTPQGLLYLRYATAATANEKKIRESLLAQNNTIRSLTLGSMPSLGAEMLPLVISEYLKITDINISLRFDDSSNLFEMLKDGSLDIAILSNSLPVNDFISKLLFHDQTICVCSRNHPLAEKTVYLEDLYNQRLLLGNKGSDFNDNLNILLKKNNSDLSNFPHFLELGNATAIKNQLSYIDGITFMYSAIFHKELQSGLLKQIYIKDFMTSHSIYFCYLRNALFSDEYDAFFDAFKKYIQAQTIYNNAITSGSDTN